MATTNTMSKLKFSLQALIDSVTVRATKGVLILVLDDMNVQGMYTYRKLKKVTENWEVENKEFIAKAFSDYGVKTVLVASAHTLIDPTLIIEGKDNISASLPNALAILNKVYQNGYLIAPQVTLDDDKKKISDFIKSQRKDEDYPLKGVIYNYASDNEAIINFTAKDLGTSTSDAYTVDVASYLCILGANESITNHTALNVTNCDIKADEDICVSQGELFLFNNGTNIVFSRGVNSKQTLGISESEVLTKIRVVDVIDMVKSDLREIFNNSYLGKMGNSYANRKSLVGSLNTYLKGVATQGYLSNDEMSYCELDVDATRVYLESKGIDTDDMKDTDVLKQKIDTHVFIRVRLYIMDCIEDVNIVLQYQS